MEGAKGWLLLTLATLTRGVDISRYSGWVSRRRSARTMKQLEMALPKC